MTMIAVRADARALPLADASVDLVVTSPPYYDLRHYEDHGSTYAGQVGSEPSVDAYVASLVDATVEMARALKPGGSIFINLGDKYEKGCLLGVPWMYAFAVRARTKLLLRSEQVWVKTAPMPEKVVNRPRRNHETWLHFVHRQDYYCALDRVRERPKRPGGVYGAVPTSAQVVEQEPLAIPKRLGVKHHAAFPTYWPHRFISGWCPPGVCDGCGETVRTTSIKALDSDRPQARRALEIAARAGLTPEHLAAVRAMGASDVGRAAATQDGTGRNSARVKALYAEARTVLRGYSREFLLAKPVRLAYACGCQDGPRGVTPAVVLDSFGGSGTTAQVASAMGRIGVTGDLSSDYCRVAADDEMHSLRAARLPEEDLAPTVATEAAQYPREATA